MAGKAPPEWRLWRLGVPLHLLGCFVHSSKRLLWTGPGHVTQGGGSKTRQDDRLVTLCPGWCGKGDWAGETAITVSETSGGQHGRPTRSRFLLGGPCRCAEPRLLVVGGGTAGRPDGHRTCARRRRWSGSRPKMNRPLNELAARGSSSRHRQYQVTAKWRAGLARVSPGSDTGK